MTAVERGCSAAFCGGNSPEIDHYGLHELNVDHVANDEGFVLLGATLNDTWFDVVVSDSTLAFVDSTGKQITGPILTGGKLWLQNAGVQYAVVIGGVGSIDEVISPYRPVPTYVLLWASVLGTPIVPPPTGTTLEEPAIGVPTPVCPLAEPPTGSSTEWDESYGMVPYDSVLFEGDRINGFTRTVLPEANNRWFNIGCSYHTLAKLRITRNTLRTVKAHDWRQVQATLKMLSADYCGNGTPFTVAGQPVVWRNRVGMSFWSPPAEIEARWNENGARCLDTPRVLFSNNPELLDVEAKIAATCRRPSPCTSSNPDSDADGDRIVSGDY